MLPAKELYSEDANQKQRHLLSKFVDSKMTGGLCINAFL